MIRTLALTLALVIAPTAAMAKASPGWLEAPGRSPADMKRDAERKPVEILRFLGIRKGQSVLDYVSGGGYYADIMANAVGPKGKVFAWNPEGFVAAQPARDAWAALTARQPTITHVAAPFDGFQPGDRRFDLAVFHLVYHDLYWQSEQFKVPRTDPDVILARLFAAMKKGGVVGVIDHVGPAGDTRKTVDSVHRIDPETVKADFKRAGFRLVKESALLRMPGDDLKKNVFDPAVRGKTDRFVLKFIKP